MEVIFRTDSSLQIGTGHVMRCLTLANALREKGIQCVFICREHEGNIIGHIEERGFAALRLPRNLVKDTHASLLKHATWLGTSQEQDAKETIELLKQKKIDWLIVDHYALDKTWEELLRPYTDKVMVIDDLADRKHNCDLLLDQNLGHTAADYENLVPKNCHLLIGPKYALLRPEFAKWRAYSLKRRQAGELKEILISLGGIDKDNYTSKVLKALQQATLPQDIKLTVVMGATSPHLEQVKTLAVKMPNPTQVLVNVNNMAELMANSDLAIGAAGSTAWERCCLGLPSVVMVLEENQRIIAKALANMNYAISVDCPQDIVKQIPTLLKNIELLKNFSFEASNTVFGGGAEQVSSLMIKNIFSLRSMEKRDLAQVLAWRNHPRVRGYMLQQNEISEQEHCNWFNTAQQDKDRYLLILERGTESLGFLNLRLNECREIDWGFYLKPSAQGGIGKVFGALAVDYCFNTLTAKVIYAKVLSSNLRSQRFHERLGFSVFKKDEIIICYSLRNSNFAEECP